MYIGLNTAIVGQKNPSLTQIVSSLFSNGEQGVWYDPSDFSTLFQDSAGTTPVTAVGQPVGLMLDKSKGLVLGPELGSLNLGVGDFTIVAGTVVITDLGDRLRITRTSSVGAAVQASYDTLPIVAGKTYVASFDILAMGENNNAYSFILNGGATEFMSPAYSYSPIKRVVRNVTTGAGNGKLILRLSVSRGANPISSIEGDWIEVSKTFTVRELPGNHATQRTTASRPTLQIDTAGNYYLSFDGVDDYLSTESIDFTATDKMTVFAGVRKLSDVQYQMIVELSTSITANNGSFSVLSTSGLSGVNADKISVVSRGTNTVTYDVGSKPASANYVLCVSTEISTDTLITRVNGTQVATSAGDQGTGNYGNYPLYIGRRGGTTLSFNGRLYGLVVRGALSSTAEITSAESYMNTLTRAY